MSDYYECDGRSLRDRSGHLLVWFHGLSLCDGCRDEARDALRELRQPLIEALQADPTLERAQKVGFELTRRDDGRFVWVDDDEEIDGGIAPYTKRRKR